MSLVGNEDWISEKTLAKGWWWYLNIDVKDWNSVFSASCWKFMTRKTLMLCGEVSKFLWQSTIGKVWNRKTKIRGVGDNSIRLVQGFQCSVNIYFIVTRRLLETLQMLKKWMIYGRYHVQLNKLTSLFQISVLFVFSLVKFQFYSLLISIPHCV